MPKIIKKIVIHHTAGNKNESFESIKALHLSKGYSDIAYNRVILLSGEVKQGRPDDIKGGHAYGANNDTLGVVVVGNFMKEKPNEKQEKALIQTLATLCKRYNLTEKDIVGHRDIAKLYNVPEGATACPGDILYLMIPNIRNKVKKYL